MSSKALSPRPERAAFVCNPAWKQTARLRAAEYLETLEEQREREAAEAEAESFRLSADDLRALNAELDCYSSAPNGVRYVGGRCPDFGRPCVAAESPKATEAAGAEPSITAPASSQGPGVSGGFDTLDVTFYVTWNPKAWKELRATLQWAKEQRQNDRLGYVPHPEDGLPCPVEPDGLRHGPKGAGVVCPWVMSAFPDVELHIADAPDPGDSGRPNVFLHIGAKAFLSVGGFYWFYEVVRLLTLLGATVEKHVISRVDGCVDLPGVGLEEFVARFIGGKRVMRPRKWAVYGEGVSETGLSVGRGTVLRIYDKLREVRDDNEKFQLMLQRRWFMVLPDKATRVEFQLRNDELRENYGISTISDLEAKAGALFTGLAESWFRLTEETPDRDANHQSRAVTAAIWCKVQEAFAAVFNFQGELLEKPVRVVPNVGRLQTQIGGCLSSVVASLAVGSAREAADFVDNTLGSFENFIGWAVSFLAPLYGDMRLKAIEKLAEFRSSRVANTVGSVGGPSEALDWRFGSE